MACSVEALELSSEPKNLIVINKIGRAFLSIRDLLMTLYGTVRLTKSQSNGNEIRLEKF